MEHMEKIPFDVEYHEEAWYQFPQSFQVPKGYLYRTDSDFEYRRAEWELTIDLCCAGDWLQVIDPDGKHGIRYEIR